MDIRENFYSRLQTIREEAEVKPNDNSKVIDAQGRAKTALRHLRKYNYKLARKAVQGSSLEPLDDHLKKADFHWERMNIKNNLAVHPLTSDKRAKKLRDEGIHHQEQAERHHDNAVEYLEGHLPG